jgi:hypothetical protein
MLLKTDDSNGKDVRLLWNNSVVELPQTNIILENLLEENIIAYNNEQIQLLILDNDKYMIDYGTQQITYNKLILNPTYY